MPALDQPAFRKRFEREALTLARLQSVYVLSIYDYGDIDGWLYLTNPYLDGGDLQARIDADPYGYDPREALRLVTQAAAGLAAAHRLGIIHRDIKPSNILLAKEEDGCRALIADFGIARDVGVESTLTGGGVIGTLPYMPPERHLGHQATASGDVYALGSVLWAMLHGRPPFLDESGRLLYQQLMSGPSPLYMGPLAARISPVLDRCLAHDPRERYPDAAALHTALLLASAQLAPASRRERHAPTPDDQPPAPPRAPGTRKDGGSQETTSQKWVVPTAPPPPTPPKKEKLSARTDQARGTGRPGPGRGRGPDNATTVKVHPKTKPGPKRPAQPGRARKAAQVSPLLLAVAAATAGVALILIDDDDDPDPDLTVDVPDISYNAAPPPSPAEFGLGLTDPVIPATPPERTCHSLTADQIAADSDPTAPVPCNRLHTTFTVSVLTSHLIDLQPRAHLDCVESAMGYLGGGPQAYLASALEVAHFVPTAREKLDGASWVRCDVTATSAAGPVQLPKVEHQALRSGTPPTALAECARDDGTSVVCTEPHAFEVIAVPKVAGNTRYPNQTALNRLDTQCPTETEWYYPAPRELWESGYPYLVCLG